MKETIWLKLAHPIRPRLFNTVGQDQSWTVRHMSENWIQNNKCMSIFIDTPLYEAIVLLQQWYCRHCVYKDLNRNW